MCDRLVWLTLALAIWGLLTPPPTESADPVPKQHTTSPSKQEAGPKEALAAEIRASQEKGVKFLKDRQRDQGSGTWSWEDTALNLLQPGGTSALAVLALLESGVKPDDETVSRGLAYLRTVKPQHTYVVSVQTQVLCLANQKEDAERIRRNVQWIEDAAVGNGKKFEGWSYTATKDTRADHSITQFAVAALYAANRAGFKAKREDLWTDIRDLFVRSQKADGGWGYAPELAKTSDAPYSTHSMTVAGLTCLALANSVLGKESKAGEAARRNGEAWVASHFQLESKPSTLYNLDAIAALGRASGAKTLGSKDKKHEWYKQGAEWLLKNQKPGGEWQIRTTIDDFPIISTSFALRFLASRPD